MGFPGGSEVKASVCNVGDLDSIPGSGRFPGEGNGNPLQYSCPENPMDGGAWWATVHGVTKSRTRLSNFTFTFIFKIRLSQIIHLESESSSALSDSLWPILQARILESVAFPFSRGSSQPRDQTQVSYIAGRSFANWAIRDINTMIL